MAKAKVTPEEWAGARKEWEGSATVSYADIARKLLISKALVGQEAKRAGWQKRIGVAESSNKPGPEANSKLTENARQGPKRAPVLDDSRPSSVASPASPAASESEAARQVDAAAADAMANRSAPTYDEIKIPDGLDLFEREDFVRAAIVVRQRQINATQSKELSAVKQKLYNAIKNASTDAGPALALAVERNVRSMVAMHDAEMEKEIAKVRLDLSEFAGAPVRPMPARIIVHMIPGFRIGSDSNRTPAAGSREVEAHSLAEVANLSLQGTCEGNVVDVESRELPNV
ncbi:hypothetical protein R69888_01279 [Paraburkholderia haematera]|uniref:Terminase small subunit n=1 Tax=Paraburkholderia haematera TaxID=2793077 RepID=A0ABM8QT37_9BURK|nr:hypothetical protein R69888_01279 [Paraburkholderia haematera]